MTHRFLNFFAMTHSEPLNHPWLVAVWPGMGHVALSAGYYLMSKLGMSQFAELSTEGVFDVDAAIVKKGLIQPPHLPRSRLFSWKAPAGGRDMIVFIGESQPQLGKFEFCRQLIDFSHQHGVQRVFTFAAMATDMQPGSEARVFAAATDQSLLDELQSLGNDGASNLQLLEDGHVGGLNGVLLAAAIENRMPGVCLLGEMPHIFIQTLYPKASLAVLRLFTKLAAIDLDLAELAQHAEATEHRLANLVQELQRRMQAEQHEIPGEEPGEDWKSADPWKLDEGLSESDRQHIESLFQAAKEDRSRAFELKNELDRLGVFAEYENRFLDLFKTE